MKLKFGRKFEETLKFVILATVIAFVLVFFGQTTGIISAVFNWCTQTDLGYMWVINIVVAILLTNVLFYFVTKEKLGLIGHVVKVILEALFTLIAECAIWHRGEAWQVLTEGFSWAKVSLAGLGILAATVAFLVHLRGIDYGEE